MNVLIAENIIGVLEASLNNKISLSFKANCELIVELKREIIVNEPDKELKEKADNIDKLFLSVYGSGDETIASIMEKAVRDGKLSREGAIILDLLYKRK